MNQMYEERVWKFFILAGHRFKGELYHYIYIVAFVKHLPEHIGLYKCVSRSSTHWWPG